MKERLDPKKLDNYKRINLVDFASSQYGYKIDSKDSTKKWPVLRNQNDDKMLMHQNENGQWSFTNLHNDSERGSIFDFINKEQPKLSFKEIVDRLEKYEPSISATLEEHASTANVFDKSHLKHVSKINENNIMYLVHERKIDPEILLNDPKFKDKIQIYSSDKFKNIAFPITNDKKPISGFILKNKEFSGYLKSSEHSNSLWVSNYDRSKPVDKLFISESPIDSISHYQLNKKDLKNKNVVYMATGGSPTKGQINLVDKFVAAKALSNMDVEQIESLFDNDLGGRQFAAKFNGELKSIKKTDSPDLQHIGYSVKKDNPNIKATVNFSNTNEKELTSFSKRFDKEKFNIETSARQDGTSKVELTFPKESKEHWKDFTNGLNDLNKNKVANTFPKLKDFNKELQNLMKNQKPFKNISGLGIPKH